MNFPKRNESLIDSNWTEGVTLERTDTAFSRSDCRRSDLEVPFLHSSTPNKTTLYFLSGWDNDSCCGCDDLEGGSELRLGKGSGTIGETPCSDAEARLRGWTGEGTGSLTLAFMLLTRALTEDNSSVRELRLAFKEAISVPWLTSLQ